MNRIVRLTSNDYRDFRRAYSKILYSFSAKGKSDTAAEILACKMATETSLRPKGEFLNHVEDPNREMYFFKVEDETQGYFELIFHDNKCNIFEFAVFERYKGYGSLMWEKALDIIKEHGAVKIELWCPYEGAQIFWKKKGFKPFLKDFFRRKVR